MSLDKTVYTGQVNICTGILKRTLPNIIGSSCCTINLVYLAMHRYEVVKQISKLLIHTLYGLVLIHFWSINHNIKVSTVVIWIMKRTGGCNGEGKG